MDARTAETTARNIQSLLNSPGWKDWLAPLLRDLKEKIKEDLLNEFLNEADSTKLRARYQLLTEIESKPAVHLAQMREILTERNRE